MVIAGFRMAYVNPLIKVRAIDTRSFRKLARSNSVMSVPKTVINEGKHSLDGNVPIDTFLTTVLEASQ